MMQILCGELLYFDIFKAKKKKTSGLPVQYVLNFESRATVNKYFFEVSLIYTLEHLSSLSAEFYLTVGGSGIVAFEMFFLLVISDIMFVFNWFIIQ